jgi:hypothetical protein
MTGADLSLASSYSAASTMAWHAFCFCCHGLAKLVVEYVDDQRPDDKAAGDIS